MRGAFHQLNISDNFIQLHTNTHYFWYIHQLTNSNDEKNTSDFHTFSLLAAPRGVDVHTLRCTTTFAATKICKLSRERTHRKKKLSSTNLIINFSTFTTTPRKLQVLRHPGKFSLYSINFHNAVMHFSTVVVVVVAAAGARVSHFDERAQPTFTALDRYCRRIQVHLL